MSKYFGQVNFTIEADDEESADQAQRDIRDMILHRCQSVVDASADEPVELDEFGHAG